MQIIPLQTRVSKTAAYAPASGTGTLDVSSAANYGGDWRVKLKIHSLTAGKRVSFKLENVAAADFTGSNLTLAVDQTLGQVQAPAQITKEIACKRDKGMNVFGVTNGKIRICVDQIDAGATVDYEAWVEIP